MSQASRPRLQPRDCELCDCQQYRWNLAPCALYTDPPSTCRCDHPTSRHRFRYPDGTLTAR